jgi:anthranilate phosphoribosyltransferase
LRRLIAGARLSRDESAALIGAIMDGELSPAQSAGLLVALATRGEEIEEIEGAAVAMRDRAVRLPHGLANVVDIVGTGGDGKNTINISTMAALLSAAAGVPVAKHGNRASSSLFGSADVLEATGFPIDLPPERAARVLHGSGFTFMFANRYHPAMKNVAPIRRELGIKTIFNVLGPLTNPARAEVQIVGVARPELLEPVLAVLRALGVRRGAVVYGENGIDEVAGDVPSRVYAFDESGERRWNLDPAAYGVTAPLSAIVADSVDGARNAFLSILGGEVSPRADVVALNAALVLHVAGIEPAIDSAFERARSILTSGAALATYERAKELAVHG